MVVDRLLLMDASLYLENATALCIQFDTTARPAELTNLNREVLKKSPP